MILTNWIFRFTVIAIMVTVISSSQTSAQINFKLGGGIGLCVPASDYAGSTIDYYSGSNYGLHSGINIHGKAKIGLSGFNITGEIDYAALSNSGNSEPGQGQVDVKQKVVSFKVGPEFRFNLPVVPITPYIRLNLALNSFSGETTFQGVAKVPSGTYTVASTTRLGIGFDTGVEVTLNPALVLDFDLSYNLMNISGAEWKDANPAVNQRLDSYLSLNDAADPLYATGDDKHFNPSMRSIHSILFTVSILFGL